MKRVVITGLGTINPLGHNVAAYWENMIKGVSGAAGITRFDASKFKTRFACEIKEYDPNTYFEKGEARKYDLFTQYALISAEEAINQAGLLNSDIDFNKIGVIWASGNGGIGTLEHEVTEFAKGDGTPRFNPFLVPKMIANMAPGMISIKFGFKGINYATVSACAASNNAIMDAFNYIRWGKANVMITGGSEAPVTYASVGGFNSMKALSTRNDDPAAASRPFDKNRDGFVLGEGAGALILESYEHAIKRGATILAEIIGASMTADAYHMSATHPEGEGAYRAINLALEDAGITIDDVDYVNAHATSTGVGDPSEIIAMQRALENTDKVLSVSATKSMTGHLLGGAGAIEAIACIKALHDNIIPPTINIEELEDMIPANIEIITNKAQKKTLNICMSNTFGFGGHNAIAIFKKYSN
ncbi:MAG TPA: beta-ketoacyl-ACP synthase II [Flavipsychrobacter sp.]|nr:beta-ketoacyl-ACP synthase II [Flavipsychrobacter sp.]